MKVYLTIDVECYSGDYDAEVYGEGLGLPFILDSCKRHGLSATFFVESLGATQWGGAGVRRICRDLNDNQQDIQLHLHPSVAMIDGIKDCRDVFRDLEVGMQEHLLRIGRDILRDSGVSKVVAFRAGDLAADAATLIAMDRVGIRLGSNRDLDGKCSIRSKLNHVFPVVNDVSILNGQMDLPVTAMRSMFPFIDGRHRHFEISALGAAEMKDGIRKLQQAGYATVTILTHPGEFFRKVGGRYIPVRKNCRRWEVLLEFLSRESGLVVQCVGDMANERANSGRQTSPSIPLFNPLYSLARIVEQAKHRVWAKAAGVRP